MAKRCVYDDLYARLETKEGEKELYRLARQRDRAKKNVQHVRVIKDENSNVMVNSEAVLKRWKEYFEKLMNEENNREPRTEEAEVINEEVNCVSREEVKNALRRMKKGKAIGPDELPGKRRGRPKRRFLDVVKEDMKEVGVKEMDIEDRKMWRMMIRCGHP